MTRDEILAELAVQQARIDQANTLIESATAAKLAAEADIVTGTNQRADAQQEIVRLLDELANLPPETDWRKFGTRRTNDLDRWEARFGVSAVVVQTFSNDQPFNSGKVAGRPDRGRWLCQITYPHGGSMVRGKTAKPADVAAQRDSLRAVGAGQRDVMLRRAAVALQAKLQPGDTVRIDNERCVNWFWYGSAPMANQFITQAQATQFGREIADAHRAADERFLALAFEEWGAEFYSQIIWDICVAGNFGDPFRHDLLRREWPRVVPPGTKFNLGTDAYVAARGDTARLRSNLAAVDMLAAELPNVVSISIDEWGPHNGLDPHETDAYLDGLADEKEAFVAETVRWMQADHPVPLAWVALYETIRPNNRHDSTVLFADRDQRPPADDVIILRGRENASFVAANGERVPSNDPEMAAALLAAIA